MKKRAAFIVEKEFFSSGNFGVRNYVNTIKHVVEEMGIEADYIYYRVKSNGGVAWYKITPRFVSAVEDRNIEYFCDTHIDKITFSQVEQITSAEIDLEIYTQSIGDNLFDEHYDYVFITSPWAVTQRLRIDAGITIGLLYDCIPNLYALLGKARFDFAYTHTYGYEFYNEACDYIMADSEDAIETYRNFFGHGVRKARLGYFKPFVPWEIVHSDIDVKNKENAVILSAPFDPRKGLQEMPAFLNEISNSVDTLYIYGRPRCEINDFNGFFRDLDIGHVIYYPSISFDGLAKLYSKCKFLFFPSFQEGLGLPLIEAQICGCRVITRDISPMNILGLTGAIYFKDATDVVEEVKCSMSDCNFSYEDLRSEAMNVYMYSDIEDFMKRVEKCEKE